MAEIKCARLRWAGHIIRRDEESNVRKVWECTPEGHRPKGRPQARWWDQTMEDMRVLNLQVEDAYDRFKWRRSIGEAKCRLRHVWPWM